MGVGNDVLNGVSRAMCFSTDPDGNFEGLPGLVNRIILKFYIAVDFVLDRQETQYHTTLVIGLAIIAMAICGFLVTLIMKSQRAPLLNDICRDGPPIIVEAPEVANPTNKDGDQQQEEDPDTLTNSDLLIESLSEGTDDTFSSTDASDNNASMAKTKMTSYMAINEGVEELVANGDNDAEFEIPILDLDHSDNEDDENGGLTLRRPPTPPPKPYQPDEVEVEIRNLNLGRADKSHKAVSPSRVTKPSVGSIKSTDASKIPKMIPSNKCCGKNQVVAPPAEPHNRAKRSRSVAKSSKQIRDLSY
ncbi:uncharacterized protein LOC108046419 [Drosophila rhopaloa]|uniref:Uncharacterized protein LOC108046419 n=1 Tax=Drosophila rhopaloa TaxID=1041015 RepID=A0A6P4EXT3_DRORH|nr:uncharacterized protein LOC108046419 [Drosophila rhopaloa]